MLLRLAGTLFLLARSFSNITRNTDETWISAIAALFGLLLLAGLWTPVAAVSAALLEIWIAFRTAEARSAHLLVAVIGLSLAVLGPGAWSVDARLFGRRRISISDR